MNNNNEIAIFLWGFFIDSCEIEINVDLRLSIYFDSTDMDIANVISSLGHFEFLITWLAWRIINGSTIVSSCFQFDFKPLDIVTNWIAETITRFVSSRTNFTTCSILCPDFLTNITTCSILCPDFLTNITTCSTRKNIFSMFYLSTKFAYGSSNYNITINIDDYVGMYNSIYI